METLKVLSISAVFSTVVTLLTGLWNTTPNLVGATWYGWPMAWMYQYVTFPPSGRISFSHLAVDFVVWTIVIAIILSILWMAKKPTQSSAQSGRRSRR